ncbi:MAG: sortase, partial [Clostridia bacterium]
MNQILVTEKLYITPELKRKKKIYKIRFFLSVFLICVLFSYYIYAESDRNKSEEVSQQILASLENNNNENVDTTTKNIVNDVIIVALDEVQSNYAEPEIETVPLETESEATYTTDQGESYTTDAILTIPSLDISYPVLSETSEELLKISLNKYWGPEPNKIGNYCIVGHNYANGKLFGKLSQMEIGDIATLKDMSG